MPILEVRRIYKAGGSLALTLPKGWLAYFNIKCGDEVEVEGNGQLTIRPRKKGDKVETPVNVGTNVQAGKVEQPNPVEDI